MSKGIAISCCDGRIQKCVLDYLRETLNASTVDMVTDWNPVHILVQIPPSEERSNVLRHVDFLIKHHEVDFVGVIAHHGCDEVGDSALDPIEELRKSVHCLARNFPHHRVIGLWIDEMGSFQEVDALQDCK